MKLLDDRILKKQTCIGKNLLNPYEHLVAHYTAERRPNQCTLTSVMSFLTSEKETVSQISYRATAN